MGIRDIVLLTVEENARRYPKTQRRAHTARPRKTTKTDCGTRDSSTSPQRASASELFTWRTFATEQGGSGSASGCACSCKDKEFLSNIDHGAAAGNYCHGEN
ncbi:unnamed protein product [Lampetra fluviatilis]